jgi:Flp pilus assembly protein TadG
MKAQSRFAKGQMLVLFTLVLPVLLGGMGLATDIGVLYFNWGILQKAADASALAGAAYLVASPLPTPQAVPVAACPSYPGGGGQTADAQSAACTYVTYNGAKASEVTGISIPAPNVPASVPAGVQTIQVALDRPNVPTYFLHMVGVSSLRAKAQAIAMAPTSICGSGNGMFPVGVPETLPGNVPWESTVGTNITLTEGTYPQTSGNWEWLSIPNGFDAPSTPTTTPSGGTSQLASTITTGCVNCQVNIGDWVTPQTGNSGNSNPITTAIDDRISSPVTGVTINSCNKNSCSNSGAPSLSNPPASAPQLVTLPVVNWSTASGGSSPIEVVGFITAWLKSYATSQGVTTLTITVTGSPANTQVNSGNCAPTYPGLTQAELVQ